MSFLDFLLFFYSVQIACMQPISSVVAPFILSELLRLSSRAAKQT